MHGTSGQCSSFLCARWAHHPARFEWLTPAWPEPTTRMLRTTATKLRTLFTPHRLPRLLAFQGKAACRCSPLLSVPVVCSAYADSFWTPHCRACCADIACLFLHSHCPNLFFTRPPVPPVYSPPFPPLPSRHPAQLPASRSALDSRRWPLRRGQDPPSFWQCMCYPAQWHHSFHSFPTPLSSPVLERPSPAAQHPIEDPHRVVFPPTHACTRPLTRASSSPPTLIPSRSSL